jgi:hypothetical protein
MAERGHQYRDPVDLRERFSTAPGEGERRVALAEAECVVASRLAETGHRLERELGEPVRAKYAGDIRAYRELQVAALPRAADLIGE